MQQWLSIPRCQRYERLLDDEGKGASLIPEAVERIKSWIRQCSQTCDPEIIPAVLPKRLLDAGSIDGRQQIRLLDHTQPLLQGETRQTTAYAALSYCWGNESPLMTTSKNLHEMLDGISFECLPKVYQHAIIVCRSLQIRYLWIDSLCIIQGDKTDWESESPKMAQYYEHAYLTIIPAAATSCYDGFLERLPSTTSSVEVEFQSSLNSDIRGSYFIGHDFTSDPGFSLFYQDTAASKWGTRGWTFCEGLFSKRRVYFGKNAIHWSCRSFYASELSNHLKDAEEDSLRPLFESSSPLIVWYTQHLEYSVRKLSRRHDRLPAISPLAQVIADMTRDVYLAGLWKSSLHVGLLWYASDFKGPIIVPEEGETRYIAPSWSWLARARNAEISHYVLTHEAQYSFNVLEAGTTLDGINPYGRVSDGYIKVQGQVYNLLGKPFYKTAYERRANYQEIKTPQGRYIGECSLDLSRSHIDNHGDYQLQDLELEAQGFVLLVVRDGLCLKGKISRAGKNISEEEASLAVSGLVLIPSGRGNADEYCRMGIFESPPIEDGGKRFFEECELRTITLV